MKKPQAKRITLFLLMTLCAYTAHAQQLNMNTTGTNPRGPNYSLPSATIATGTRATTTAGAGVLLSTAITSNLDLATFDLTATNSYYGIYTSLAGVLNITNGNIFANNNKSGTASWTAGYGIYTTGIGSTINITNANIEANNNGLFGVNATVGTQISIVGSSTSDKTFTANNNKTFTGTTGSGIVSSGLGALITIDDMKSVEINGNGFYGIQAELGGRVFISGTGTGSTFNLIDNKNIIAAGTWGNSYGVSANGANASVPTDVKQSTIDIDGFETVNIKGSGQTGLVSVGGGVISLTGAGTNSILTISDNRNKTGVDGLGNDIWINGFGINVSGANITTPTDIRVSQANIYNFKTVDISNNGLTGVSTGTGGLVTFQGTGAGSSFKANNNFKSDLTEGRGLIATGVNATDTTKRSGITLSDFESIEINDNGYYGINVSAGGFVDIAGTGTSTLAVNNNNKRDVSGNIIDGYGLYITGAGSTINITNIKTVNIDSNGKYGIYMYNSGAASLIITGVNLSNSSFTANSNKNTGVYLSNSNQKFELSGFASYSFNSNLGGGYSSISTSTSLIEGLTAGSTITANGNTLSGISVLNYATIKNIISITTSGNSSTGLQLGSNVVFQNLSSGISFISNNNTGSASDGMYLQGITVDKVVSLSANNNGRYGIYITSGMNTLNMNGGAIDIKENGTGGIYIYNTNAGLTLTNISKLSFTSNLANGFTMTVNATFEVEGIASGITIGAYNNGGIGLNLTGINIFKNVTKFEATGNTGTGIFLSANTTYEGIENGISFVSTGNTGDTSSGIMFSGVHTFDNVIEFKANNNSFHGVYILANSSLTLDIHGSEFSVNGNGGSGINLYGGTSAFTLKNIGNANFSNNGISGISGHVTLEGTGEITKLIANNNGLLGISMTTGFLKNITEIETNENGRDGLVIGAGVVWESLADSVVKLTANDNVRHGMQVSVSIGNVSELTANNNGGTGMSFGSLIDVKGNITANGNVGIGIRLSSASILTLDGTGQDFGTYKLQAKDTGGTAGMGIDVHGGTLTVKNILMELANESYGILVWYTGTLNIEDSNIDIRNTFSSILSSKGNITIKSQSGLNTYYAYQNNGGIATQEAGNYYIENMNITLEENVYGIRTDFGGGNLTIKGNTRNTLTLKNSTIYGILTKFDIRRSNTKADIIIDTMIINSSGSNFTGIATDFTDPLADLAPDDTYEKITFKNSQINIEGSYNIFEVIDARGTIVVENTTINGGTILLNNEGTGSSIFNVVDSNLRGQILSSTGFNSTASFTNSSWKMENNSNFTSLNMDTSTIDVRGTSYNTLSLSNITSTDGQILLKTYFDDDGLLTDKIILDNGVVSGTTILKITAIGTNGADNQGNGIKVVNAINGTITDATNFTLLGGFVDSGAYQYELVRGDLDGLDENSFYLRSNGTPTNTVNTIADMPAIHLSIVKTGMNSLRKRMGDIRLNDWGHETGFWVRSYIKNLEVSEHTNSTMQLFGGEAGIDTIVYSDFYNSVYIGAMAGYLYTDNIEIQQGQAKGQGKATTPSIGLYASWINRNEWYVDATLRYFVSSMDVINYDARGNEVNYSPDRNFITSTIETGYQFSHRFGNRQRFAFTPKLEVGYAYSKGKSFNTNTNNYLYYGDTESLTASPRFKISYDKFLRGGEIIEWFTELGISQELAGTTGIEYEGKYFKSDVSGTTFEFAVGFNGKFKHDWNLYSDITYETGNVYEAISLNLGIRHTF